MGCCLPTDRGEVTLEGSDDSSEHHTWETAVARRSKPTSVSPSRRPTPDDLRDLEFSTILGDSSVIPGADDAQMLSCLSAAPTHTTAVDQSGWTLDDTLQDTSELSERYVVYAERKARFDMDLLWEEGLEALSHLMCLHDCESHERSAITTLQLRVRHALRRSFDGRGQRRGSSASSARLSPGWERDGRSPSPWEISVSSASGSDVDKRQSKSNRPKEGSEAPSRSPLPAPSHESGSAPDGSTADEVWAIGEADDTDRPWVAQFKRGAVGRDNNQAPNDVPNGESPVSADNRVRWGRQQHAAHDSYFTAVAAAENRRKEAYHDSVVAPLHKLGPSLSMPGQTFKVLGRYWAYNDSSRRSEDTTFVGTPGSYAAKSVVSSSAAKSSGTYYGLFGNTSPSWYDGDGGSPVTAAKSGKPSPMKGWGDHYVDVRLSVLQDRKVHATSKNMSDARRKIDKHLR